jgi:NAD(P)-dependent dehydrogenase (short-subunit alcohol dehydrogenase family)
MTSPGFSVYNSSKFAVEGLSEGLWYELGAFGVKVKLIEPGVIKTDFGGRSMDVWDLSNVPDYTSLMEKVRAALERFTRNPSAPEVVAATIFKAANDPSDASAISSAPTPSKPGGYAACSAIERRCGLSADSLGCESCSASGRLSPSSRVCLATASRYSNFQIQPW